MNISFSDCRQEATNKIYRHLKDATEYNHFKEVFSYDHLCGKWKDGIRTKENFVSTDCLVMDCDNDHSDNSDDWITVEKAVEIFSKLNVKFVIVLSRNNNKVKHAGKPNEQSARPRFHLYFPLTKEYNDPEAVVALKEALIKAFPFFDKNAKDITRFIFGVEEPEIKVYTNRTLYIDEINLTTPEQEEAYRKWENKGNTENNPRNGANKGDFLPSVVNNTSAPVKTQNNGKNDGDFDKAEILNALSYIDPDGLEYNDWLNVGFALHTAGLTVDVWDAWSRKGKRYKEGECESRWGGFDEKDGITPATIFYFAKQGGYLPPAKRWEAKHCQTVDGNAPATTNTETPENIFSQGAGIFPPLDMLTEEGQANVFLRLFGDKIRYVKEWGWREFTGKGWEEAPEKIDPLNGKTYNPDPVKNILLELNEKQRQHLKKYPPDDAKTLEKLVKFCKNTQQGRFLNSVAGIIQGERACSASLFNTEHNLLNCNGTIIDLTDGTKRKITDNDLISQSALCEPSEDGLEMWVDFLKSVIVKEDKITPDLDLIDYLQQWLGGALLCDNPNPQLLIAYGDGANGKSTLFNVVGGVLGEYCQTLNSDILDEKKPQSRFSLACLFGARLAIFPELPEGAILDGATLKKIASRDLMRGELKYQAEFSFNPTHTPIVYTNALPTVKEKNDGMWRRIVIFPFYRQFKPEERDNTLLSKLKSQCGGAIMKWLVDGAIIAYRTEYHLNEPEAVKKLMEQYRTDNNEICQFFEAEGYVADGGEEKTQWNELWRAYLNWGEGEGIRKMKTATQLKKAIKATYKDKVKEQKTHTEGKNVTYLIGVHTLPHF